MIARENGRMQLCCDTCPASYPNTYDAGDFTVMVADAKTAGWQIRKAPPPAAAHDTTGLFGSSPRIAGDQRRQEPYIHTCPGCAKPALSSGFF